MQFVINHSGLMLLILNGVLSEILAVRQYLKYPENQGVGGLVVALMKLIKPMVPVIPPVETPPQG